MSDELFISRKNSVLEELKFKRFAVVQEEMCSTAFYIKDMLESKLCVKRDT